MEARRKTLSTALILAGLGAGQLLADTGTPNLAARVPGEFGTFGSRNGEPVLLIRDFLPWGGDIVPFFTNAGTVVTVIPSSAITSVNLSDYCLIAITAGTTGWGGVDFYQANVNAAVPLFTNYVLNGGIMLYLTGTWGGTIQMPGGAFTQLDYDSYNYFVGPHYMATGMPYPMFDGNYASHDDLLGLPGNANVITTGSFNQVTAAEWALGNGAVVALTQPTECYIPGGWCYPSYAHFNQFETNAVEYARNLGSCGDPLPVDALLTPTFSVNCLGDPHNMTVTITDDNNQPVAGVPVSFDVVAGPNMGVTSGTLYTNALGQAYFSYTSAVAGADLIFVNYLDETGAPAQSNPATKVWEVCNVDADETAASFALGRNHPNPFNPVTTITFSLAETAAARLAVYNLAGVEVATLVDGILERGEHQVTFNGEQLSSGIYLYRLESQGQVQAGRMLLVK